MHTGACELAGVPIVDLDPHHDIQVVELCRGCYPEARMRAVWHQLLAAETAVMTGAEDLTHAEARAVSRRTGPPPDQNVRLARVALLFNTSPVVRHRDDSTSLVLAKLTELTEVSGYGGPAFDRRLADISTRTAVLAARYARLVAQQPGTAALVATRLAADMGGPLSWWLCKGADLDRLGSPEQPGQCLATAWAVEQVVAAADDGTVVLLAPARQLRAVGAQLCRLAPYRRGLDSAMLLEAAALVNDGTSFATAVNAVTLAHLPVSA